MKNPKWLTALSAAACLLFAISCASTDSNGAAAKAGARRDLLYVCNCGSDCKCVSVKTKPGKCGCGHELKAARLVKVVQNDALLCPCEVSCQCTIDAKDDTKCSCGKAIRKVNLKGTGIYFCNCGGSCTCNTVQDTPGQCKCGMQLKRVD
jgi:hypothetical protein